MRRSGELHGVAQKANAASMLNGAASLLNDATNKLSGGDTQGAWTASNQAKLIADQAKHLVEGDSEGEN